MNRVYVVSCFTALLAPIMVAGSRLTPLDQPSSDRSFGGVYEGSKGTITSRHYPDDYPNNEQQNWYINSDAGTTIRIVFEHFETEEGSGRDYLDIWDGTSSSDPMIASLYGYQPEIGEIVSTGNALYLLFRTDSSVVYSGFKLNWYAGLASCYDCDNYPGTSNYDPACIEDSYHGTTTFASTCYTNVHYDGSNRVERGGTENSEENGACFNSGFAITCYCNQDNCNTHLCDHCATTTPLPTTTEAGNTTTAPTSLQCYACSNCGTVNDDTNIDTSEDYLSCFTAVQLGDNHMVVRGGSNDYFTDGTCREVEGVFVCYCTSNKCNSNAATNLAL